MNTTRPRLYLVIADVPNVPELKTAAVFTSKDEMDVHVDNLDDGSRELTIHELDNLLMSNCWLQTFNENDHQ